MKKITYHINDINDTCCNEGAKWNYSTFEEAVEAIKEWVEYHSYMWDEADIYAELGGEYSKYNNASDYAKDNVVIEKWDEENNCPEEIYDCEGIKIL